MKGVHENPTADSGWWGSLFWQGNDSSTGYRQ